MSQTVIFIFCRKSSLGSRGDMCDEGGGGTHGHTNRHTLAGVRTHTQARRATTLPYRPLPGSAPASPSPLPCPTPTQEGSPLPPTQALAILPMGAGGRRPWGELHCPGSVLALLSVPRVGVPSTCRIEATLVPCTLSPRAHPQSPSRCQTRTGSHPHEVS